MRNVKILEMPPMMQAIKCGDLTSVRSLLDEGIHPDEKLTYKAESHGREAFFTFTPFHLAIEEGQEEIVHLLVERGADLNPEHDSPLFLALGTQNLSLFRYFFLQGARVDTGDLHNVFRLFSWMEKIEDPAFYKVIDQMELPVSQVAGEALRAAASSGNLTLARFLVERGADVDYHEPDMIYPYASTPVLEAARSGHREMAEYLVSLGADITIADDYGDRPYSAAQKEKHKDLAAYFKTLEPEDYHNAQEKVRALKPYKLPPALVEYLKSGALRLEFPDQPLVKWAQFYSYMDTVEVKRQRRKYLSLLSELDGYSDYLLLWDPKDKKLCFRDVEHDSFHTLCTWEEFISRPGDYLNGMVEGVFGT